MARIHSILLPCSLLLLRCSTAPVARDDVRPVTNSLPPPPNGKWRHPCPSSASEHHPSPSHALNADTHVDVYLWNLQQLSKQLQPLLHSLQPLHRINLDSYGAQRVQQFEFPGMTTTSGQVRRLTSAVLQRWDRQMATAAIFLQHYRSFAARNQQLPATTRKLNNVLHLVLRSQCRVQLLHNVRFGHRSWASHDLAAAAVVPVFCRRGAPQATQHLCNFVTVRQVKAMFQNLWRTFAALRSQPSR